jgi:hypothetical protein
MLNISNASDIERDRAWLRLTPGELAGRSGIRPARLAKLRRGAARLQDQDKAALGEALHARLRELQAHSSIHFKAAPRVKAAP